MNDRILWDIIDGLRDEVNIAQDGINDLNDVVKDLQAVNDTYQGEIFKLEADNKRLRKENAVAIADERVIKELQAENKRLQGSNGRLVLEQTLLNDKDGLYDEVKELQAENKRLMSQVSSISSNSSSTHTHTIKKEIAEYMENNEGCDGARLFLIPRDEFKNGEYDNTIYWDDGIE